MPRKRQSKRKLSENEDYDSDSDFETEMKKATKNRNAKKKKVLVESESSVSEKSSQSENENLESGSDDDDDDEPLSKIGDTLKQKNNSEEMNTSSDSSDDEPLATKRTNSSDHSNITKKSKSISSESEENGVLISDEDELSKTSKVEKSKKVVNSSDSSDDEPLAAKRKKSSEDLEIYEKNKSAGSESEENRADATSDDDDFEVPSKVLNKSKVVKKKSEMSDESSYSLDDVPLAAKTTNAPSQLEINKKAKKLSSGSEENECEATSEEDEPVIKMAQASKIKRSPIYSSSNSSDDVPLATKNKKPSKHLEEYKSKNDPESAENGLESSSEEQPVIKKAQASKQNGKITGIDSNSDEDDEPLSKKSKKVPKLLEATNEDKKHNSESEENGDVTSDDEKPLNKVAEPSRGKGKTKKVQTSNDSSDDEPLTIKKPVKQQSKKQRKSHVSSDEDKPISNLAKVSSQKNNDKKVKNSTNDRVEHLKKYLRLSGIHIQSYDKLFVDCKSIKAKTEKLLSILHDKGMKGRPTIEKCKKLRKKIETKNEIAELDTSNIIKAEGRPKRGSCNSIQKAKDIKSSPAEKRFSRLKDIIDSEESD